MLHARRRGWSLEGGLERRWALFDESFKSAVGATSAMVQCSPPGVCSDGDGMVKRRRRRNWSVEPLRWRIEENHDKAKLSKKLSFKEKCEKLELKLGMLAISAYDGLVHRLEVLEIGYDILKLLEGLLPAHGHQKDQNNSTGNGKKKKAVHKGWTNSLDALVDALNKSKSYRWYFVLFELLVSRFRFHHIFHILFFALKQMKGRMELDESERRFLMEFCLNHVKLKTETKPKSQKRLLDVSYLSKLLGLFKMRFPEDVIHDYVLLMTNNMNLVQYREVVGLILEYKVHVPATWEYLVNFGVENNWQHDASNLVKVDESKNLARLYIKQNMARDNLKEAHSCMIDFELYQEFPEVVGLSREIVLEKTIAKHNYGEAIFRLERYRNLDLSKFYLRRLVNENQHYVASYVANRLGLSDAVTFSIVDKDKVREEMRMRAETFLALPAHLFENILFVDDQNSTKDAISWFQGLQPGEVVGLDTEWKAQFGKTGNSKPSILQLGCRKRVLIIDLLWLGKNGQPWKKKLESEIEHLFVRTDVVKLGFSFGGDLTNLSTSYPKQNCWKKLNTLLDFHRCSVEKTKSDASWVVHVRKKGNHNVGLKNMVENVLGKSLCKLEQLSNWESRPLSPEQLHYSALDVFSLVQIFDTLFQSTADVPKDLFIGDKMLLAGTPANSGLSSMAELESDSLKRMQGKLAKAFRKEKNQGVVRIVELPGNISSVPDLSKHFKVGKQSILKTLAFICDEKPILVVTKGDNYVNERFLAHMLKSTSKLRKATANECLTLFGMPVGGIGPFPNNHDIKIIIDESVPSLNEPVYCGFGTRHHVLYLKNAKLLGRLVQRPAFENVSKKPKKEKQQQQKEMPKTLVTNKFICDTGLNRLAKALRISGQDCLFYEEVVPDAEQFDPKAYHKLDHEEKLLHKQNRLKKRKAEVQKLIQRAKQEDRIILTVDRKILNASNAAYISLLENSTDRFKQLKEVVSRFNIHLDETDFLSRCVICNGVGFEIVSKEEILQLKQNGVTNALQVPDEILDKMTMFYKCKRGTCNQIFWEGPKFAKCCNNYKWLYAESE